MPIFSSSARSNARTSWLAEAGWLWNSRSTSAEETNSTVAKRLHDYIYSSGGSRDPEEAYVAFRGREPEPDALLRRRGLLETSEAA